GSHWLSWLGTRSSAPRSGTASRPATRIRPHHAAGSSTRATRSYSEPGAPGCLGGGRRGRTRRRHRPGAPPAAPERGLEREIAEQVPVASAPQQHLAEVGAADDLDELVEDVTDQQLRVVVVVVVDLQRLDIGVDRAGADVGAEPERAQPPAARVAE